MLPSWETFVAFVFADDLSMILRCHLSLEVALNKVIEVRAQPHPTSELDRLPFMAKVDLCIAIGPYLGGAVRRGLSRTSFAMPSPTTSAQV